MVKESASRAADSGFDSFSGSSLTSGLKLCTPVATLSDAWRSRVSVLTGGSGVSKLCDWMRQNV